MQEMKTTVYEILQDCQAIEDKGITFLKGNQDTFMSYHDMYMKAMSLKDQLYAVGVKQKDEIVLQLDNLEDFIMTLWACFLGGFIAVPVSVANNNEGLYKLRKIVATLNHPYIVSAGEQYEKIMTGSEDSVTNHQANYLLLENLERIECESGYEDIDIDLADIAFIQFSSGSTGNPKGVTVTHESLLANMSAIKEATALTEKDRYLSWMPLTHDLGLIGLHLVPLYLKANQYLMQTNLFLRRPNLWLEKIDHYDVSITASPNFGYHFLLNYIRRRPIKKELDLSSLRLIFNGAEPISVKLAEEFLDEMKQFKLAKSAMYPVYGLAEATLAVSFPELGAEINGLTINRKHIDIGNNIVKTDATKGLTVADVGSPLSCNEVKIIDDQGESVPEECIGHIYIKGKNVTKRYYNHPDATKELITNDGWLHTQDIGFMSNGHLYVTGRSKDVIFVNGQNVYAHDIERLLEDIPGVELGKAAAIGYRDHDSYKDDLIIFVKSRGLKQNIEKLTFYIKQKIAAETGIVVHEIIPVKDIPKTTSGKLQRYKLAQNVQSFREKQLSRKAAEVPNVKHFIMNSLGEVLDEEQIDEDIAFFEMGIESIQMIKMISDLEDYLSIKINPSSVWNYPTINLFSEYVEEKLIKNES